MTFWKRARSLAQAVPIGFIDLGSWVVVVVKPSLRMVYCSSGAADDPSRGFRFHVILLLDGHRQTEGNRRRGERETSLFIGINRKLCRFSETFKPTGIDWL